LLFAKGENLNLPKDKIDRGIL